MLLTHLIIRKHIGMSNFKLCVKPLELEVLWRKQNLFRDTLIETC